MTGLADAPATGVVRIDPLAPSHPGRWEDDRVVVCHVDRGAVPVRLVAARPPERVTEHFEVHRQGARLLVLHRLRPDELDDDIAGLLAGELGGLVASAGDFERVFTGIVRSTISDPLTAWSTFYANSLAALRAPAHEVAPDVAPESSLAAFAPVHERALVEIRGRTVLDVGSCFGFLPLRLAQEGFDVVASDHTPGTMGLLGAVARRRGEAVRAIVADARALPVADGAVDTVTAVHLLEHLPPRETVGVLDEALRVARRRVVVAVPYEDEPEPVYGHLRTFDHAALHALGERSGRPFTVADDHGGWLVIEA
ncbi:mycofactocin oligosaccharide methyltransferase MftM [Actinomycetospora lemnae]|uniref:Mycofactocin oligosaccharide methyltransferase MftM n=1 Tax=Actinomycetospora lemnae TaxID=3019891 RepID=A0ABT5T5D9_9PSEU|nr:mycofactocin oligosaccharide methyltransferase MftM [Actinomycetospora sp. DW7H6]MDD7969138.1 mycofactocin oligosaccharide methyltransferase MftM [Actinomycetospora sp. DW7H6]